MEDYSLSHQSFFIVISNAIITLRIILTGNYFAGLTINHIFFICTISVCQKTLSIVDRFAHQQRYCQLYS